MIYVIWTEEGAVLTEVYFLNHEEKDYFTQVNLSYNNLWKL